MNTKQNLIEFAKYLAIVLYIMLTIIVCAFVWNTVAEPFVLVSSILLFICNGLVARHLIKLFKPKKDC